MLLRFQKAAARGNYETGNQAFLMRLRFLTTRVLDVWLPFWGAGGFETYGGRILVVVEGDAVIAGVSGPQRGVSPGWLPMLLLAEA